jgi:hypothetical protein
MQRNKHTMRFIAVLPLVNQNYTKHTKVTPFTVQFYNPVYTHWYLVSK